MKRILILEDEAFIRKGLVNLVEKYRPDDTVYSVSNIRDALKMAEEMEMHLFLADIILSEQEGRKTGIDFARQIRQMEKYYVTPFVFITSVANQMGYSFKELHCYDYLLKPVSEKQVKEILMKTLHEKKETEVEWIDFKVNGVIYPVDFSEIMYAEADGRGMKIHTKNEVIQVSYESLRQFEERTKEGQFIRIHRGYIVSRNFIASIDLVNHCLNLKEKNGVLPIGKNYFAQVKEEWIHVHH